MPLTRDSIEYSAYVDDSNQTNPDGLWRAWLKSYNPGSSWYTNQ